MAMLRTALPSDDLSKVRARSGKMAVTKSLSGFRAWYRKFVFSTSNYNQYGLKWDDLLYESDAVQEAIRRLPQKVKDERTFRIFRASYLCAWHKVLPQTEWTKYEEDTRYLTPLVEEVEREIAEIKEWDNK